MAFTPPRLSPAANHELTESLEAKTSQSRNVIDGKINNLTQQARSMAKNFATIAPSAQQYLNDELETRKGWAWKVRNQ